jgi:hypothetical protein
MGTRKVKLTGLGYWSKVFAENRDLTGFENALVDIGGQTSIDLDIDAVQAEKLKKSRSMKRGTQSPDNDGLTRVKFTRKWTENYGGGAPTVIKADGSPWDYDEDGPIGNGSTVEVVLSVYDTSRKSLVGTRLDKIKVVEHKPYNPEDDDDDDEAPPAPAPRPSPKANTKSSANKPLPPSDLDDEIPF